MDGPLKNYFEKFEIVIWLLFQSFVKRCENNLRGLSQITFAFFGIFWPRTSLVCTFYVVNYTFFWPPTHPKVQT